MPWLTLDAPGLMTCLHQAHTRVGRRRATWMALFMIGRLDSKRVGMFRVFSERGWEHHRRRSRAGENRVLNKSYLKSGSRARVGDGKESCDDQTEIENQKRNENQAEEKHRRQETRLQERRRGENRELDRQHGCQRDSVPFQEIQGEEEAVVGAKRAGPTSLRMTRRNGRALREGRA